MTREEAIAYFNDMNECTYGSAEPILMAIEALKREQQFLDAGYKNGKVEFYIGGRKFMVKELAQ